MKKMLIKQSSPREALEEVYEQNLYKQDKIKPTMIKICFSILKVNGHFLDFK